ncbi:TPA: hypothetical protein QFA40_002171 [Staphylococcus aureus]|nr:hypothetical protein [Staphylococcus aureus]HDE9328344.1 hypothetical protein [Staphylococcus aureus]HDT7048630.1 hypothetical protein [Staphylococcus aureus]
MNQKKAVVDAAKMFLFIFILSILLIGFLGLKFYMTSDEQHEYQESRVSDYEMIKR